MRNPNSWIPIIIALVALGLSIATFYYNYVHVKDELTITMSNLNFVKTENEGSLSRISCNLIFMNNGTKDIIVTEIYAIASLHEVFPPDGCIVPDTYDLFENNIEPLKIPAQNLVTFKIEEMIVLREPTFTKYDDDEIVYNIYWRIISIGNDRTVVSEIKLGNITFDYMSTGLSHSINPVVLR